MEIHSKLPPLGQEILSIFLGILVVITLVFEPSLQENETGLFSDYSIFDPERLVLLEGNTLIPISNLPDSELKVVRKLPVVVTAYSSSLWETDGDPQITAAGTLVRDGIIANNLLPFGTKLRLPEIYGDKIFVVEDRMNRRKGHYQIDIWFSSYWEAKNFGVKRTYIEILES